MILIHIKKEKNNYIIEHVKRGMHDKVNVSHIKTLTLSKDDVKKSQDFHKLTASLCDENEVYIYNTDTISKLSELMESGGGLNLKKVIELERYCEELISSRYKFEPLNVTADKIEGIMNEKYNNDNIWKLIEIYDVVKDDFYCYETDYYNKNLMHECVRSMKNIVKAYYKLEDFEDESIPDEFYKTIPILKKKIEFFEASTRDYTHMLSDFSGPVYIK